MNAPEPKPDLKSEPETKQEPSAKPERDPKHEDECRLKNLLTFRNRFCFSNITETENHSKCVCYGFLCKQCLINEVILNIKQKKGFYNLLKTS